MATDSATRSVTNTLSTTDADTITLNQLWPAVEITNHDATEPFYVRMDGTTAVAEADGATIVPAGATKILKASRNTPTTNTIVLSVVGSGNAYTIEGVQ